MKLEELKDDAARIDFLLHALGYVTGCECCLRSGMPEGSVDTCIQTTYRSNPMAGGKLCPDMDFNDMRPIAE